MGNGGRIHGSRVWMFLGRVWEFERVRDLGFEFCVFFHFKNDDFFLFFSRTTYKSGHDVDCLLYMCTDVMWNGFGIAIFYLRFSPENACVHISETLKKSLGGDFGEHLGTNEFECYIRA